jgi:hypothetical protein
VAAVSSAEDPAWKKATFSGQGSCVEVAFVEECVLVRDSKDRHGAVLRFSPVEWKAFLAGVEAGEFTLPG